MSSEYQLTPFGVLRVLDGSSIPPDPANLDYQVYLAWVAVGNTPAPYIAPPAPPLSCTPYQLRAALTQLNLRNATETAVEAASTSIKDAYAYAQLFYENDPMVLQLAPLLGQTTAQVHALFQLAQTLTP